MPCKLKGRHMACSISKPLASSNPMVYINTSGLLLPRESVAELGPRYRIMPLKFRVRCNEKYMANERKN